jgi:hypothetical protein
MESGNVGGGARLVDTRVSVLDTGEMKLVRWEVEDVEQREDERSSEA